MIKPHGMTLDLESMRERFNIDLQKSNKTADTPRGNDDVADEHFAVLTVIGVHEYPLCRAAA